MTKSNKPTRFCPCCQQQKKNVGFIAVRRKNGRIIGYRCAQCKEGKPGKSPHFAKPAQPKDKGEHYKARFKLEHFQDEINDRE